MTFKTEDMPTSPTPAPLAGLTVIETASFLTGPFCAMMLADLGARVIKVEPPGGDPFRKFGYGRKGASALWINANRGKQSVVIDLKSAEGLEQMKRLVASADVLVENWRPRVAASLGLGEEALRKINPKLIRLSVTGYGDTGPLAAEPAFDGMVQGRSGIVAAEADVSSPHVTPFSVVDKVTSAFGAQAVIAALFARERTGRGASLKMPMLDIAAYFNFCDMFQHRTFADDTVSPIRSVSQVLETTDGHIVISPLTGKQLSNTLSAIGREEWKAETRRIADPVEMSLEFYRRVGSVVKTNTRAHWLARFAEHDVPAAPVMTLDEHLEDPQVLNNEIYRTIASCAGEVRTPRYPARFDDELIEPSLGAPALGADQHILDEL